MISNPKLNARIKHRLDVKYEDIAGLPGFAFR
jgi:hypothetical protein